jgi:hypothetical protein
VVSAYFIGLQPKDKFGYPIEKLKKALHNLRTTDPCTYAIAHLDRSGIITSFIGEPT